MNSQPKYKRRNQKENLLFTCAAGNITVLPAGVGVGGVAPRPSVVSVRVSAEVRLKVCECVGLWCYAAGGDIQISAYAV